MIGNRAMGLLMIGLVCGADMTVHDARAQTLDMRPIVTASNATVWLRDLVQDPSVLPEGWGERAVRKAPSAGKPQQVSLTAIAYDLQHYPDMEKVTLRGTPELTLQRQSRALSREELSRAVTAYVQANDPWRDQQTEIEFQKNTPDVHVPQGKLEIKVTSGEARDPGGEYLFKAQVLVDGVAEAQVQVPARVLTMKEVWIAACPIPRGKLLAAEDLGVRRQSVQSEHGKAVPSAEDILGMEIDRQVNADQPILRSFLREPVCAQRGDVVQVTARRGNLEVALKAKALSGGRRGDRILCMNEGSKRQFVVSLVGVREANLGR